MTEQIKTSAPSSREIFEHAQRLFLNKDLNGFADMFALDGVHELPFAPSGVPKYIQGREKIRKYLTGITDTPIEHREFRSLNLYETTDPDMVIAEYDAHGKVLSTGRAYQLRYIQVMKVKNGEIVLWRNYWNPLAPIRILGVWFVVQTFLSRLFRKK